MADEADQSQYHGQTEDDGVTPVVQPPVPAPPEPVTPPPADTPTPQAPSLDPDIQQMVGARAAALHASLAQGVTQNPENYARTLATASQLGVDPGLVQRNQQRALANAKLQGIDVDGLTRNHPELADWLSNRDNAALAHQEVPGLTALDHSLAALDGRTDVTGSLPAGYQYLRDGTIAKLSPDGKLAEPIGDRDALIASLRLQDNHDAAAEIEHQMAAERIDKELGALAGPAAIGANFLMGARDAWGRNTPEDQANFERFAGNFPRIQNSFLFNDLTKMAGSLAAQGPLFEIGAGVSSARATISLLSRARELTAPILGEKLAAFGTEQAKVVLGMAPANAVTAVQDLDENGSASHAALNFLISSGTVGAIPMSGFGQKLFLGAHDASVLDRVAGQQGYQGVAQGVLSSMGLQATQGAVQSLGNDLNDALTLGKPMDPMATLSRMATSGAMGGVLGMAFGLGPAIGAKHFREATAAKAGMEYAEQLGHVIHTLQQSDLTKNAPEAMQSAMQAMSPRSGNIYMQAKEWQEHWLAEGEDPVAHAEAAGAGPSFREAQATGGEMQIPALRFMQEAAKAKDPTRLVNSARAASGAPSAAEGHEILTGKPDEIAAQYKELGAALAEEQDKGSPESDQIHDEVLGHIMAAQPSYTPEQADRMASVIAATYGVNARIRGKSALDLYRREFPLEILSSGKAMASAQEVMDRMQAHADATVGGATSPDIAGLTSAVEGLKSAAEGAKADPLAAAPDIVGDTERAIRAAQPSVLQQGGVPVPDGATGLHRATTLRGIWKEAHGGKLPAPGDKAWARLVEMSDRVDRANAAAKSGVDPQAKTERILKPPAGVQAFEQGFHPHIHGGDEAVTEMHNAEDVLKQLGPEKVAAELKLTLDAEPSIPLIHAENVPYGMGMDPAGTKVFVDPQFKPLHVSESGKDIDTIATTRIHEITETRWMNAGHTYEESHAVANAIETAYLMSKGFSIEDVRHYEKTIHPMLRKTREWTGEPPAELNRKPYAEEGELGLLHEDGKAQTLHQGGEAAQVDTSSLQAATRDWLEKQPPEMQAHLASSIDYLRENPDPAGELGNLQMLAQVTPRQRFRQEASPRGSMTFGGEGNSYTMHLGPSSDVSTVLHEFMHMWTEVMGKLAQDPNEPQQLRDDYQRLLDFSGYGTHANKLAMQAESAGIKGKSSTDDLSDLSAEDRARVKELDAPHEKIAEAFEAYFQEGKAPSDELRPLFQKIKGWMLSIYSKLRGALSDEVRGVFDRMLVAGDAVDATAQRQGMEPAITEEMATKAGWGAEKFAAYAKRAAELAAQAKDKAQRDVMREYRKTLTADYRAKRETVKDEAAQTVGDKPVYAALSALQDAEGPRGEPLPENDRDGVDVPKWKLDKGELVARYGEGILEQLPGPKHGRNPGKPVYAQEGGLSLDRAAELLGYKSGDELVRDLRDAPSRKAAVESETNARMAAAYPDAIRDGKMPEDAMDALHTKGRSELEQQEAEALATLASGISKKATEAIAKVEKRSAAEVAKLEAKVKDLASDLKIKAEAKKGDLGIALRKLAETAREDVPEDIIDYRLSTDTREPASLRSSASRLGRDAIKAGMRGDADTAIKDMREASILNRMAAKGEAKRLEEQKGKVQDLKDAAKADVKAKKQVIRKAVPLPVVRSFAKLTISKRAVKDLNPAQYREAERIAHESMMDSIGNGDYDAAFAAKQRKVLNGELYRAAKDALDKSNAVRDYITSTDRPAARERTGKAGGWEWTVHLPDGTAKTFATQKEAEQEARAQGHAPFERTSGYLQQMDAIRERYEFAKVSDRRLQQRQTLRDWIAAQQAKGRPVAIPKSVLDDVTQRNWRELSVENLHDVGVAIRNIDKLARLENHLLSQTARGTFRDNVDGALETIPVNLRDSRVTQNSRGLLGGYKDGFSTVVNKMYRVHDLIRRLDGHESGGKFYDLWERPMDKAADQEQEKNAEDLADWNKALDEYGKVGPINNMRMNYKKFIPEINDGLSKWSQIMVAYNWGNEGNRQRVMDGNKWTKEQVAAILNHLDGHDKTLVHAMWRLTSKRRSEVGALEERVHGEAPEWVQPSPFQTKEGTWDGGYAPIVYDYGRAQNPKDISAQEDFDLLAGRGAGYAMTSHGYTKERSEGLNIPLKLELDAFTNHLARVNRDLAWRETLMDANRILNDHEFSTAVTAAIGKAGYDQFNAQLQAVAATKRDIPVGFDRPLGWLRQGSNAAMRSFNIVGTVMQIAGLPSTIVRVGPGNWVKALGDLFSPSSWRFVHEQSTVMRFRNAERGKMLNESLSRTSALSALRVFPDTAYMLMNKAWAILDTHAWYGAYHKAMRTTGGDEAKSRDIADSSVAETQGATHVKDQAQALRGGELAKVFTNNLSWGSANFNLMVASLQRYADRGYKGKDAAIMASEMGVYLVVCPMLYWMARQALGGTNPTEQLDTGKGVISHVSGEALYTLLSSMPVARDFAALIQDGKHMDGLQGTSGLAAIGGAAGAASHAVQDWWNDKEEKERPGLSPVTNAAIRAAGPLLHFPSSEILHALNGYMEAERNGTSTVRGAIFGPKPK